MQWENICTPDNVKSLVLPVKSDYIILNIHFLNYNQQCIFWLTFFFVLVSQYGSNRDMRGIVTPLLISCVC